MKHPGLWTEITDEEFAEFLVANKSVETMVTAIFGRAIINHNGKLLYDPDRLRAVLVAVFREMQK